MASSSLGLTTLSLKNGYVTLESTSPSIATFSSVVGGTGNVELKGITDPSLDQSVATKAYVDASTGGTGSVTYLTATKNIQQPTSGVDIPTACTWDSVSGSGGGVTLAVNNIDVVVPTAGLYLIGYSMTLSNLSTAGQRIMFMTVNQSTVPGNTEPRYANIASTGDDVSSVPFGGSPPALVSLAANDTVQLWVRSHGTASFPRSTDALNTGRFFVRRVA